MTSSEASAAGAGTMPAWVVTAGSTASGRLARVDRAIPVPAPGEVLVQVQACGICRTDLHLADGDLPPQAPQRVPGHEIVGAVIEAGPGADRFAPGERVGIAWLAWTCGTCRWCRAGRENLCPDSRYTGWHHDGGYAGYAVASEAFAYRIPERYSDEEAAPLLCSGIIGYRALRRANLPPGGRLGIYGFGASAHLTIQLALAQGAEVHVLTRDADDRGLAVRLGATSVGGAYESPPTQLDAAILFAPVGDLVPTALSALDDGGTLAVAGIHLTDIPTLDYQRHLFRERVLTSVTSNTRADGEEFLRLASELGLRPHISRYAFSEAETALEDLARGKVVGAAVLSGP